MQRFSSFSKSQRIGIFALLISIIITQIIYYVLDFQTLTVEPTDEKIALLRLEIDSLKKVSLTEKKDTIYPFNPNYLTDYKGYLLGMTTAEIDRLLAFRKEGKFINSAADFQAVTKISDSLLFKLKPYFKFPEWVNSKQNSFKNEEKNSNFEEKIAKNTPKKDINEATKEDLMQINGIGDAFSDRILKYREKLGGFLIIEQVSEVFGLENAVFQRIKMRFEVKNKPIIEKKNINELSLYELAKIPYLNFNEAKKIVALRSEKVNFKSLSELLEIEGFTAEKVERLQFYLKI